MQLNNDNNFDIEDDSIDASLNYCALSKDGLKQYNNVHNACLSKDVKVVYEGNCPI